nr:bZIP transcription factor [uncultured Draconibacterium sp.]
MKKLFTSTLLLLLGLITFAQTPQSFNYQAVLRDASGNTLANQDVEIEIKLIQDTVTNVSLFSETHSVTTNEFGLVNLQIGSANSIDMETIDWSTGPYFIEVSVDGTLMGTSQLLSVPFAMHAVTVENDKVEDDDADPANELQQLAFVNNELSISDGNVIDLSALINTKDTSATNELQQLALEGEQLTITEGNTVDLSSLANIKDTSVSNELQDISLSGTELSISKGSTVDLSVLQDGTGTDEQKLTFYGGNRYLTISNGNSVHLPFVLHEQDDDKTNELQALSISNDTISISNGNYVKLPVASKLSDADNDTKIQVEENPDEDMLRVDIAGSETLTMNNSTGTILRLPTNDENSNLKVANSDGTVVFGVDGTGMLYGDGSGLSNVKPLINSVGGNSQLQITENYSYYQNIKSVTITTPSSGKCFVMASGYVYWQSEGWDVYISAITKNSNPNTSWDAELDFYNHLNIATDYNCADFVDQYASFAQHRCFNVGAGTQTFTLWANKYRSSAKVRMDDVNLTVLFFPTAGTGEGTLKSTQLDDDNEQQESDVRFTSIPRRPDGGELRKRLDAMMNSEKKPEVVSNNEFVELHNKVDELEAENEKLRKEKSETDQRISAIEYQVKRLLKTEKLEN